MQLYTVVPANKLSCEREVVIVKISKILSPYSNESRKNSVF